LVTHGPPKLILDLVDLGKNRIITAGDDTLSHATWSKNIPLHLFGHIHNNGGVINTGIRVIGKHVFSNASAVRDGEIEKGPVYSGHIIKHKFVK
jgi:Icc-related predicted phosphoesterase